MSLPEVDPIILAKVQAIADSMNHVHAPDVDAIVTLDGPDERIVDRLRMALLDIDGLNALPAPEPLIDGLLVKNSLAVMWGLWATGKSFLALDFALCVASGKAWQARAVAPGPVLYVAAEGTGGLLDPSRVCVVMRSPSSVVVDRSTSFTSDAAVVRAIMRLEFAAPYGGAVAKIAVAGP